MEVDAATKGQKQGIPVSRARDGTLGTRLSNTAEREDITAGLVV